MNIDRCRCLSLLLLLIGGFLCLGFLSPEPGASLGAAPLPEPLQEEQLPKPVQTAIDKGLSWLALHQCANGSWSLHEFSKHARSDPFPAGKAFTCNCTGVGTMRSEVAGTALALLPFLAAGHSHKAPQQLDKEQPGYHKTVLAGLQFLLTCQARDGSFGTEMYPHGLATWAVCEAYGLSADPLLKVPAQKAISFLVEAQDPAGGGWRYQPRTPGDLSVTGYEMRALKAGQLAGLAVPAAVLRKAEGFLATCLTANKGYSYTPAAGATPNMTAVGITTALYLGADPRNADLRKGLDMLKQNPPGKPGQLYYDFHAVQAAFHGDPETFKVWMRGAEGQAGLLDALVKRQDRGGDPRTNHQEGSWGTGEIATFGQGGGRLLTTSLSLLTLEMPLRKLVLFHRARDQR